MADRSVVSSEFVSPNLSISSLWLLSSFLIGYTTCTSTDDFSLFFAFLICRLFTHRSKAVKWICSTFANRPNSSFQRGHYVILCETRTGTSEPGGLYPRRGMRSKLHTHISQPELQASCRVNKENRQRVRAREHKLCQPTVCIPVVAAVVVVSWMSPTFILRHLNDCFSDLAPAVKERTFLWHTFIFWLCE